MKLTSWPLHLHTCTALSQHEAGDPRDADRQTLIRRHVDIQYTCRIKSHHSVCSHSHQGEQSRSKCHTHHKHIIHQQLRGRCPLAWTIYLIHQLIQVIYSMWSIWSMWVIHHRVRIEGRSWFNQCQRGIVSETNQRLSSRKSSIAAVMLAVCPRYHGYWPEVRTFLSVPVTKVTNSKCGNLSPLPRVT